MRVRSVFYFDQFFRFSLNLKPSSYTPHSSFVAEPLNVLVACGPYTPSDSLTFDPLLDLINVIVRDRPDVCLLVQFPLLFHHKTDTIYDRLSTKAHIYTVRSVFMRETVLP